MSLLDLIDLHSGDNLSTLHDFYFYEPWDVRERPEWLMEKAASDGIDLNGGEIGRTCGPAPHPFQTGYHMSVKPLRFIVAGSRVGKSWSTLCEDIICLTGEIPFSMRFPVGHDTGIKRRVTQANVLRWGRREKSNPSVVLDFDPLAPIDDSWDCGTIIGVGIFPEEKILAPGREVWLGTTLKAYESYWRRKLDPNDSHCMIPSYFYDTSRSRTGFDQNSGILYMSRNTVLRIITYETGYNRFEAGQSTDRITLDEEPTDRRIFAAAVVRAKWLSMSMTPYNGITYTREHVFPPRGKSANSETFHACQYDSPYRTRKENDKDASILADWERAARIWGIYSEQQGKPYYDRKKINVWLQRHNQHYVNSVFIPTRKYLGVVARPDITESNLPGLMDVNVVKLDCMDDDLPDHHWNIYEDVKEGVPYIAVCDTSEGSENEDEIKDVNACGIARPGDEWPEIVATCRTKRPVVEFAESVLHACRYYNNAVLCAESAKRGATNATFYHEARDWPWWFKMAFHNDRTGRLKEQLGFDTNSKTRDMIFSNIREKLDASPVDAYPGIPDRELLRELAECVCGKNGRPDHTTEGTLDSAVWYGIMLYVWKYSREQITFNGKIEVKQSKLRERLSLINSEMPRPTRLVMPTALERRT